MISKISLFEFLNECLIFKMSPFDFPNGTFDFQNEAIGISARDRQSRRWSVLLVCCQITIGMAERDREGVFRGSCINHPPHRFGACEKFVLMEGTS